MSDAKPTPRADAGLDAEVIIVGTGFGGQCIAIKLMNAGFKSVLLLERSTSVGGTWRDNDYPGAACDIASHLYSFSFDLNPDWSRIYPAQQEINAYLQGTATRHGLLPLIQFDTLVHEAAFSAQTRTWTIHTNQGLRRARYFILATGGLSEPVVPHLPGLENFQGKTFHSAKWDHVLALVSGCTFQIRHKAKHNASPCFPFPSGSPSSIHLYSPVKTRAPCCICATTAECPPFSKLFKMKR